MSKIRVKMLTLDAGPNGVRHPETEHDIEAAEAQDLIDTGHAVEIGGVPKPRATASDPFEREQATSTAKENAAMGKAGAKATGKKK